MVFSFYFGPEHSKHGLPSCEVVGGDHLITLCNQDDFIARLSSERVAFMLSEKGEAAERTFQTLSTMLDIYPWHRRGLKGSKPTVSLNDILTFPFTLEQLEEDAEVRV